MEQQQLAVPFARVNRATGTVTCPECGEEVAEYEDRTGEDVTHNYAIHYQEEHQ